LLASREEVSNTDGPLPSVDVLLMKKSGIYNRKFGSFQFIKSPQKMLTTFKDFILPARVIGVDIENSEKSYEGGICLLQLSVPGDEEILTFVFDILTIFATVVPEEREQLREACLRPLFEDSTKMKVFHGAISA